MDRITIAVLILVLISTPSLADLERMDSSSMQSVSGRAGLNFQLKDLRLLSGAGHTVTYRPGASSDDFSDYSEENELIFENISLRETPSNDESENSLGHDNERVTTGTFDDPITLNIRGGSGGGTDEYLRLKLPENDASMEPNNFRIGGILVEDAGYDQYNDFDLGRLEIRGADYTDGTKLEISGKGNGGLMMGLGIKLDGIVELDSGNGGLDFDRILAGSNCTDNNGYTCNDDDSNSDQWNFNGGLTWADLSTNRPLALDFIGQEYNPDERGFFMEFNPDRVSPNAGQIAVQNAQIGFDDFGEIWTEQVRIVNLRIRGPVSVSSEIGDNYSCNGNNSGC